MLLKAQHLKMEQEMANKRHELQYINFRHYQKFHSKHCNWESEETCYDDIGNFVECVPHADGGCPCPEGQEKCDASKGDSGYCIEHEYCCDWDSEDTCYDDNWNVVGCVPYADGGCPCPEGQEKCGALWPKFYEAGYCTEFCCTDEQEEW